MNEASPDYKKLFQQVPGLFLLLTPSLLIVDASNAYLSATKTRKDEIIGRQLFDVFPDNPEEADATGVNNLRASLMRVLQTKLPDTMAVQKYDIPRPAEEGGGFEERYWSPINAPLLDSTNEIQFIIHRVEDVTELVHIKRIRNEEEKMNKLLTNRVQQMESDIFVRSQEIQEANNQLRSTKKELAETNSQLRQANEESTTLNEELMASNDELMAVNEQLETTTKKLREALNNEHELVEIKNRFVSIASHELRTPLSVITLAVDFLRKYRDRISPFEITSKLETISRQLLHMQHVLENLMTVGKGGAGLLKVNLSQIDLNGFFEKLKHEMESSNHDSHVVKLKLNVSTLIHSDVNLLRSIFINLIGNAIKYSPSAREVELEVSCKSDQLVVSVRDFGIGIPEDHLKDLFEPWKRANNTEGIQGTGLGLSIVSKAVKLLNGSISVKTKLNKGSKFLVSVPVQTIL